MCVGHVRVSEEYWFGPFEWGEGGGVENDVFEKIPLYRHFVLGNMGKRPKMHIDPVSVIFGANLISYPIGN